MKRTIGIVAAASLAALALGCKTTERKELPDGYKIVVSSVFRTDPGQREFRHNKFLNYDTLHDNDSNMDYIDYGCNGTVDRLCISDCYDRGQQGTEELFAQADKDFAKYKKELGGQIRDYNSWRDAFIG